MRNSPQNDWHALKESEVVNALSTNAEIGLTDNEAQKRIEQYGRNIITPQKRKSAIIRFLLQFNQALIYILLAATIVTIFLEEYVDAAVIFGVVLINAIIGFVQENKALKAIDSLSHSMISKTMALRNGKKKEMDAADLVPGDVVLLQAGDKVPADVRLLTIRDLRVDESILTGESVPVDKKKGELKADTVLGDRLNMSYASTMVAYGQARAVVVETGDHTEVGKISGFISTAEDLETPLTKKIREFSHLLLIVILGFALITLFVGLWYGESFTGIFLAAVALAVAAIPEGLPAAVTIMLAIGVTKMAKRKAIIRKLAAVETLGSTTIICSDKTGTLTENQMTVQKIYSGDKMYEVKGLGYAPEGHIELEGSKIEPEKELALIECLRCGMLCNDSMVELMERTWAVKGDPTEGAIIVSASKAGLDHDELNSNYKRLDSIPFESEYMYMATLHPHKDSNRCYVKGSLEVLLSKCHKMLSSDGSLTDIDKEGTLQISEQLASEGLRVLAFAMKDFDHQINDIEHKDINEGLIFLGIQGMIDPPRKEAIKAISICHQAGIEVKMITGDHAITASTIAGQLNLSGRKIEGRLIARTGAELSKMDDEEFDLVAKETAVFARVAPEQKLRLVKSLQKQDNIVAMTGDGVNDGPALKQANIGIAMGITGTEVAKDASDMILTDDNFSSIENAIEEGRSVFDNLVKYIVWILPTNLGQGLVILVSVLFGTVLFIQPVQVLWVNMTTAILLGLMLTFEPKEPGIMDRKPRKPDEPIMSRHLIMRTFLVGLLLLVTAVALFRYEMAIGASLEEARTVVTTVFIVLQSFYLVNCRSLTKPLNQIGYFTNPWIFAGIGAMVMSQLLLIYVPFMNSIFHTAPIDFMMWLRIMLAGIGLYIIIEIEKKIVKKVYKL